MHTLIHGRRGAGPGQWTWPGRDLRRAAQPHARANGHGSAIQRPFHVSVKRQATWIEREDQCATKSSSPKIRYLPMIARAFPPNFHLRTFNR